MHAKAHYARKAARDFRARNLADPPTVGISRLHAPGKILKRRIEGRLILQLNSPVAVDGGVVIRRRHIAVWVPARGDVTPGSFKNGEKRRGCPFELPRVIV